MGIYCRISEDRNAEGLGVARQEQDCRKLAEQRGWKVIDVYVDNDLSGSKRNVHRPEYQRMLDDARAGRIDAVAAWDFDRLTRQPRQLEAFVDECLASGVQELVTVGDNVNFGTGDGLLVARIKGAVAAEEARKLGQRVARKMQELAEDGRPNGGRRPYGFAANRIDHDPDEAEALRRAAETILTGGTLTEAARPTGLNPTVLKRILLSPRVTGLRQHHGEVIGPAVWAPIIPRADWERLRGILDRARRYSVPIKRHLLSGIAKCGECDANLSAQHKKNPDRTVYQCRSARGGCGRVAVDASQLERTVIAEVGRWLASTRVRRAAQRHLDGSPDVREGELLDAITADEQRLLELAGQVGELAVTAAEWAAMRRPVLDRIDAARLELGRIQRRPVHGTVDVAEVAGRWGGADDDAQRELLRIFGVTVVVARAGKQARRFRPERVKVRPGWAS